ncbi:MAG TPA: hypothetical protein VH661_10350 [Candidatus Dormibacteraeota bacterium]|nr:hypothetical protein [Candidatus Dormibacteraeota bacterium]
MIDDYLGRVRAALKPLPSAQSEEIVQELRGHIREAREDGATEADVRTILDRLGAPSTIAADALSRFGQPGRPKVGIREVGALLLLTVGGFVLPVIGWVAGIVMLWTSEGWRRRDKIIGTVLTPSGGLLIILGAAIGGRVQGGDPSIRSILFSNLIVLVLVMPVATAIYLLIQLNRRSRIL